MYTGEGFKMVEGSDDVKMVLDMGLNLRNETSFLGGRYRSCIVLYEDGAIYVWSAVGVDSK
jgi:hypothetical protein